MAHGSSSSRGCGTCGGGSSYTPPRPAPTYDPCTSLTPPVRPREQPCACGGRGSKSCGCGPRRTTAPTPRTYDSEACPTLAISCETKQALRECARTALCDFMKCLSETLCPDGKFDLNNLQDNEELGTDLINCVGQLACSFMHCLPEALCPEPCAPAAVPIDCLPCGYAVEVQK